MATKVGAAALRYSEAVEVRRLLRAAYDKTGSLPRLRKKVHATLKSADGAVNNARRFYDAAEREDDDDGCPKSDPECTSRADECHDACDTPEHLRVVHLRDVTRQDMTACDRDATEVLSSVEIADVSCGECQRTVVGDSAPTSSLADDVASFLIPTDWPLCACGLPVMEGHLTCGQVGCDEANARARRDAAFRTKEANRG